MYVYISHLQWRDEKNIYILLICMYNYIYIYMYICTAVEQPFPHRQAAGGKLRSGSNGTFSPGLKVYLERQLGSASDGYSTRNRSE